jgi:MoaA/NifB/PqqE/SkfB family radical SAM enzyme
MARSSTINLFSADVIKYKMLLLYSMFEKSLHREFQPVLYPFLKEIFERRKYLQKKIKNYLFNISERKRRKSRLRSYPYNIVSDPTNIYTLRCPLCPTWQDHEGRPKGKMSIELFRSVIDETRHYLFTLNLCNWGEPLLNPALPEMIAYAKNYNIIVGLSTNLKILSENTGEAIATSGLDIMVISLDGASAETYSKYRTGGDSEAVIANIKKLLAFKKEAKKFPLLIWQLLVNRYNEKEIEKAKAMAEGLGTYFVLSPLRTSMGKELILPLYERIKEMKDWLPENPLYNKYLYKIGPETRTRQKKCKWLWTDAVINWDGSA